MIIAIVILFILIVCGSSIYKEDCLSGSYISRQQCENIKGIFVFLVFIGHAVSYTAISGFLDDPYVALKIHLDQMVVVMFLFYSGYGMMESLKAKGYQYAHTVITRRFPKLLLFFDVAVLLFLVTNLILGKCPGLKQVLLSFTGWDSIGNSNWYMFIIFCMYILFFLSFLFLKKEKNTLKNLMAGNILLTSFSIILMVILGMILMQEFYFYNTVPAFILGTWYSLCKKQIESFLSQRKGYLLSLAAVVFIYCTCYFLKSSFILFYFPWEAAFIAAVILISMKVKIQSRILSFLGKHVFAIYILQRIPMMVMSKYKINFTHPYVFTAVSLAVVIPLALGFEYLVGSLWKVLDRRSLLDK